MVVTDNTHALSVISTLDKMLVWTICISTLIQIEEEFRGARKFFLEVLVQGTWRSSCRNLIQEVVARGIVMNILVWSTSLAVCIHQLVVGHLGYIEKDQPDFNGYQLAVEVQAIFPSLLAVAVFTQCQVILNSLSLMTERTGVFVLVIHMMMRRDVGLTLVVLIPYLVSFSFSMWAVFPIEELHAGGE